MVRATVATDRIVSGEWSIIAGGPASWVRRRPPLVYCHGSGDSTALLVWADVVQRRLIKALAPYFTVGVADLDGDLWGFDAETRVGAVVDYLAEEWGADGRVTLVCASMGTLDALRYALVNPDKVASVAAMIPALDLADLYIRGAAAAIDAAYGTYDDETDGPTHSPVQYAAELDPDLPIHLWTASNDPIAVPATADAFVTARPQTGRTNVGALGHSDAAMAEAAAGVVAFTRAHRRTRAPMP